MRSEFSNCQRQRRDSSASCKKQFGLWLDDVKLLDKLKAFPLGYFVVQSFIAPRLALISAGARNKIPTRSTY